MAEQEMVAVQLATMDELTLLSNRRGFISLGQHALSVCQRLNRPISLLYFDLNDFKEVNDTFGHAEGDYALTSFAEILRSTFRECDVVGRMGGDEFAVLLTDSNEQSNKVIIERLDAAVSAHNRQHKRGYNIAFSVGHVELDKTQHKSLEALMEVADERMYVQKRAGKGHPSKSIADPQKAAPALVAQDA
jgi:diguanylate cyclase (GGDEF)-like protein